MRAITLSVFLFSLCLPITLCFLLLNPGAFGVAQWLGVAWLTVLLCANFFVFAYPLNAITNSRSKIHDPDGTVALIPLAGTICFLYSIASALLVIMSSLTRVILLEGGVHLALQLVMAFAIVLVLWFLKATSVTERLQSTKPAITRPDVLAASMVSAKSRLVYRNALPPDTPLIETLAVLEDKLKYHVARTDTFLASAEYQRILTSMERLTNALQSSGDADAVSRIGDMAREVLGEIEGSNNLATR